MVRTIRYKKISKELQAIAAPFQGSLTRSTVGMEGDVGEFFYLDTEALIPFHNQGRQKFEEDKISALAESIKKYGIRQPLTVINSDGVQYEVISGERRLRAAKMIGLKKVPCIILNDHQDVNAIALVENIHRKDLHPIELGVIYKKLLDTKVFRTQIEMSEKIFVNHKVISEYIKYANLSSDIRHQIIDNNIISRGRLRAIIKAHKKNDIDTINQLIGITKCTDVSVSVLRVIYQNNKFVSQIAGIKKLSPELQSNFKNYLLKLANQIESE